jgi:hypothetical protein
MMRWFFLSPDFARQSGLLKARQLEQKSHRTHRNTDIAARRPAEAVEVTSTARSTLRLEEEFAVPSGNSSPVELQRRRSR